MRKIEVGRRVPSRMEMAYAIQRLVEDQDAEQTVGQPAAELVAQYLDAIYAALSSLTPGAG